MAFLPSWRDGSWLQEPLPSTSEDAAPGVFETFGLLDGQPGFLAAHLARMQRGARRLELPWPPPFDPEALLEALPNELRHDGIVLRLSWCPPHLELRARARLRPSSLCARTAAAGALQAPLPAGVKTTRRADYDRARAAAREAGVFEVLVVDASGALVEGTASNLFVARDGVLTTPPESSGALPGVVRCELLGLGRLRDGGGRVWTLRQGPLTGADLVRAEEVLLTSSVLRVAGLDRLEDERGEARGLPGERGTLAVALLERARALERAARTRTPRSGGC